MIHGRPRKRNTTTWLTTTETDGDRDRSSSGQRPTNDPTSDDIFPGYPPPVWRYNNLLFVNCYCRKLCRRREQYYFCINFSVLGAHNVIVSDSGRIPRTERIQFSDVRTQHKTIHVPRSRFDINDSYVHCSHSMCTYKCTHRTNDNADGLKILETATDSIRRRPTVSLPHG